MSGRSRDTGLITDESAFPPIIEHCVQLWAALLQAPFTRELKQVSLKRVNNHLSNCY